MEGKEVVVDASVVVKWFVEEEGSREARLLRGAYANGLIDVAAPSLLLYEVLNALKCSGAFGEEELKEVAKTIEDFQITLYNLQGEFAAKSVELAMRKGLTIYDASYVALAQTLNTELYTADEKLIRKTQRSNIVKHVTQFKTCSSTV